MNSVEVHEDKRQVIQKQLDDQKTDVERNAMGQFSTPRRLALEILQETKRLFPKRRKVRFIDPAFGTGAFYSALATAFPKTRIAAAKAFEIDPHYGEPSKSLWGDKVDLDLSDFTHAQPPENEKEKFNLLVCNPPYVRHHHIEGADKLRLKDLALESAGIELSGLAGLYCYFMAMSHRWMQKDGMSVWLVPSEFMDVNYGRALKQYLLDKVSLVKIHRFDPNATQFDDALVSSAVLWFTNTKPDKNHEVEFTYGGTIENPSIRKTVSSEVLRHEGKWTRFPVSDFREKQNGAVLGDFFTVKRGIATGSNKFFILTADQIEEKGLPWSQFTPVLPSPRYLPEEDIETDRRGYPKIGKRLFLLDCKLPIDVVKKEYPSLYEYLQEGLQSGIADGFLCANRKAWYLQEQRPPCRFYCTYIGRSDKKDGMPFRFILNMSKAIVTNSYLMLYPKPEYEMTILNDPALAKDIVSALRTISSQSLLDEGRVYGGGMHKVEPKELSNVPVKELAEIFNSMDKKLL